MFSLACLSVSLPPGAEVYKWTDKDGTVHYGDQRPAGESEKLTVRPAATGVGLDVPSRAATALDVVLYSTKTCGYCKKTRALLEQRGISWQEVDIESSPAARAEFKSRGGTGVPLLIINGETLQGFDEAALSATLARHGY
jgi:glutaredoxin